ncbi:DUF922 domain-containing protein [Pedobacter gandavensis]|uniref:DUF922 domain-containing protein n=1 Tax=Pedobacter gandavensis TaxID=2679963 RepID=UPI00292D98D8|nr:DUF922 domain-containing protein [Pedobacter gandavensis]
MTHFNRFLLSSGLVLGCAILSPKQAHSQENQLKRINLQWNSYQQLSNSNRPYIAYTAHQTTHKYRATQNGNQLALKFIVGVVLDGKQSIVDPKRLAALNEADQKSLLHHEQGHSDLAVIYGRILYKKLSAKSYSIKNFQKEVKEIYDNTMAELANLQARYDMETAHGEEKELQDKWDLYFTKELKD